MLLLFVFGLIAIVFGTASAATLASGRTGLGYTLGSIACIAAGAFFIHSWQLT